MIYLDEIFRSKSNLNALFRFYKSAHKLGLKQANRPRVSREKSVILLEINEPNLRYDF
jgi:hypothetical protein